MADLFEDYPLGDPGTVWDEMFGAPGLPRADYEALHATLRPLAGADLKARADVLARAFLDQGITFAFGGVERPFPLDIVPRVIAAQQWVQVEAGVVQRVRALEAFLEDNVRIPSGVSYVMENRRAMAHVLPEVFTATRIRPVEDYPTMLLEALCAASGVDDPTVVVLTPGVHNSAYFEHALLAREMGVELVEGRDLVCMGNEVFMATTSGPQRVDVIYRRVDDDFLDPVHFRADSILGCAGLLNAARAGRLALANAVGNGVADDKLLYTYVPDLIRYYLNEAPILPNVDTYRLDDPEVREYVLERLDRLVIKPVDGSGGSGIIIGSQASAEQLEAAAKRIVVDPRGWIAQREVRLSTVPTLVGDRLRPRHVDLRPFAVNDGQQIRVLAGGLTRVALPEGALVVNSSQGGGSKDTWVLSETKGDAPSRGGPPA